MPLRHPRTHRTPSRTLRTSWKTTYSITARTFLSNPEILCPIEQPKKCREPPQGPPWNIINDSEIFSRAPWTSWNISRTPTTTPRTSWKILERPQWPKQLSQGLLQPQGPTTISVRYRDQSRMWFVKYNSSHKFMTVLLLKLGLIQ